MAAKSSLRALWLNLHLWLGLGLLIPIGLIGLSGSLLTFSDDLDRLLAPARYQVSAGAPAAPSALLQAARAGVGASFDITSLRFPTHAGDPVIAQARAQGRSSDGPPRSRRVWLDPATARVLDVADPRAGLLGVAHQLHGSLLVPGVGRKIVGWMGWSLLISALTGLWLWWPRGGFWRAWNWRRGSSFSFNFHHFIGFWIVFPLAILAATGIYISFPQSARTLTQAVLHTETQAPGQSENAAPRNGPPLRDTRLNIDAVAQIARTSAPHQTLAAITLPQRPRGDAPAKWRVDMYDANARRTLQYTIADADNARAQPSPNQDDTALTVRRTHDGRDQPLWWRVIIALAGLAPTVLGLTGLLIWLKTRAAKRATRSAPT